MRFKTLTLASAAAALVAAPVALQAQVAADRAAAPVAEGSELGGGSDTLIGVLALGILAAFIVITASNDDDLPVSP